MKYINIFLPEIIIKLQSFLKNEIETGSRKAGILIERKDQIILVLYILQILETVFNISLSDKLQDNQIVLMAFIDFLALKPEQLLRMSFIQQTESIWKNTNSNNTNHPTSTIELNELLREWKDPNRKNTWTILNWILSENLEGQNKQIGTTISGLNIRNNRAHTFNLNYSNKILYVLIYANCLCLSVFDPKIFG